MINFLIFLNIAIFVILFTKLILTFIPKRTKIEKKSKKKLTKGEKISKIQKKKWATRKANKQYMEKWSKLCSDRQKRVAKRKKYKSTLAKALKKHWDNKTPEQRQWHLERMKQGRENAKKAKQEQNNGV
jgi:hypothetical protein